VEKSIAMQKHNKYICKATDKFYNTPTTLKLLSEMNKQDKADDTT